MTAKQEHFHLMSPSTYPLLSPRTCCGVNLHGLQSLRMKTFSMGGGEALAADGVEVGFGAVAGVFVESVSRIKFFLFVHIAVTEDFGKDGSGRDACNAAVAFDDGHLLFGGDAVDFEITVDCDEDVCV